MSREREGRNNVEFTRALRAAGFSSAICESINGIRKIIFENGDGVSRLLAITEISYCFWDKENGWSEIEPINEPKGELRDILDMCGKVFNDIADIRQTMKRVLELDENDERCIEVTDHKYNDKKGVIEYSIYFDSYDEDCKIVSEDDPNACQAVSIGFYYEKTSKTYEITDETMEWKGHTLHRIRALKDFNIWVGIPEPPGIDVKAGELGGWIETESNLPEWEYPSWVADDAKVFGGAVVVDSSVIRGRAQVYNNAVIRGGAMIEDDAEVYDGANVYNGAFVGQHARVYGTNGKTPSVFGWETVVGGNSQVFGEAKVHGDARLLGDAKVDYEVSGETIDE